ncbi:MAG: DNA/RNA nuclease SfsA [Alphaproteobacteria bacterium]
MLFPDPLIAGTLQRRYKRFLSDIELADGSIVVAQCPNPGAMLGLQQAGTPVWVSPARNPDRKLRYTWELLRLDSGYVGINTMHPNALAEEAILAGSIPELTGYDTVRREVRYGTNSRIDLLLQAKGKADTNMGKAETNTGMADTYVEVKNVHLKRDEAEPGVAEFPDSVTKRGTKHLHELANMVAEGHRGVMLYIVQRSDCDRFRLAEDIDPDYARAFDDARAKGVEMLCYSCKITLEGIEITTALPILH